MLHDRGYLLLISKSSQLLSEPLSLFCKLLFYGGTLWLGASFLILLRIVRSEGDPQMVIESAKERGAVPQLNHPQIACVIFNLCGFQNGELVFWPGDIGAPKQLAVRHARGTRVFSLFIKLHYFKI